MTKTDATMPRPLPAPLPNTAPDRPVPDFPDDIPDPVPVDMTDLMASLHAGWRDFRRAPVFGLAFAAFYVAGGLVLAAVAFAAGQEWWLMPFIAGFPLIAPFAAVGLYEVSRRIEAGQTLDWHQITGVVFAQKDRQLPSMAMVILLLFMFWVFVAHTTFALSMGVSSLTNITSSLDVLMQGRGLVMLIVGSAIGAGFAATLFGFTVVGLPLLLDREVDFITAIITSLRAVTLSPVVMVAWAAIIAIWLFIGILPAFLGLFAVLPILGHASWHLYRRIMPDEG